MVERTVLKGRYTQEIARRREMEQRLAAALVGERAFPTKQSVNQIKSD
jgi:hypothetical protein